MRLIAHAKRAGHRLREGLQRLKTRFACIGEIRGRGLMAGVEIVTDRRVSKKADIKLGKALSASMMKLGLSAMISARNVFTGCLRIAPPIVVSMDEVDRGLHIMERAFRETQGTLLLKV
jgi:4-aminobutyrate aminotransferase-like enzyme